MTQRNFKQDIILAVGDDKPTIILIKNFGSWLEERNAKFDEANRVANLPLDYHTGLNLLDYNYDAGFGWQDCHDIYIWSADYVYYIHEYDGSTSIQSVPRNPPPPSQI